MRAVTRQKQLMNILNETAEQVNEMLNNDAEVFEKLDNAEVQLHLKSPSTCSSFIWTLTCVSAQRRAVLRL